MRNLRLFFVAIAISTIYDSERLAGTSVPTYNHAASYMDRPMPRVRSSDSTIAALIVRAYALSATFRRVVDLIDATNGIVYVEPGRCRLGRACMWHSVTVAGPHRLLRIIVDPRKAADCDLMALIGHELWHAWEVLSDASLTTNGAIFFFYRKVGRQPLGVEDPPRLSETEAAVRAGLDVRTELLNHRKPTGNACETRYTRDP